MSDIEQLHQRISAAMDRVAYGLTQLDGAGTSGEAEALRIQLEEEKTVTAQLEERIRALKQQQAAAAELSAKVEAMDLEMQKLREANDKLREANQALREANEAGVGDPHLINVSVLAEMESLRAARAAERAEVETILSALAPALSAKEGV